MKNSVRVSGRRRERAGRRPVRKLQPPRRRDFVLRVWNAITGAAREVAAAQRSAADAGGAGGFARGGPIFGPGSSTSDSVPI
jgi:hypothetical protein